MQVTSCSYSYFDAVLEETDLLEKVVKSYEIYITVWNRECLKNLYK